MQWVDGEGANLDAAGGWSPGIGDPSVMGWVTVGVYLLAAALCARTARQSDPTRETWRLWAALAVGLFVLGLNKQLDLQSLFTQVGRDLALSQGWYAQRRWVQGGFIAVLAAGALAAAWWLRHALHEPAQRLAGLGLCFLMAFVVMRAASFHHMDQLINATFAGIRMNWVLELTGLAVILAATRRARLDRAGPRSDAPSDVRGAAPSPSAPSRPVNPGTPPANARDPGDPPLIAWLRLRLAPLRRPIERRLLRAAELERLKARQARDEAARARSVPPAGAAGSSSASRSAERDSNPSAELRRPPPRGEVTRIRRRA